MGKYSRKPKGLEESWKVGQVVTGTEAESHEQLPDILSPEERMPTRVDRCSVQGALPQSIQSSQSRSRSHGPTTLILSLMDSCSSLLFRNMVTFLQGYCSPLLTGLLLYRGCTLKSHLSPPSTKSPRPSRAGQNSTYFQLHLPSPFGWPHGPSCSSWTCSMLPLIYLHSGPGKLSPSLPPTLPA